MKTNNRKYVKKIMGEYLSNIFQDKLERDMVCDSLLNDVVSDIEVTADEDFSSEDIHIAVSRVLLQRLSIHDSEI